jgi:phage baseplate assembly protein W
MAEKTIFGFPFAITIEGRIHITSGRDAIRAKILQVLFTSPGERVNLPEFGCGLMDLVFDPNNSVLAASTEFVVSKNLEQWMGDEILVESVNVKSQDSAEGDSLLAIEIVYIRKDTLEKEKVKFGI